MQFVSMHKYLIYFNEAFLYIYVEKYNYDIQNNLCVPKLKIDAYKKQDKNYVNKAHARNFDIKIFIRQLFG